MSKRANKYTPQVRLSHKLSSILRHGNDGFKDIFTAQNGWIDVDYLLAKSVYCKNANVDRALLDEVVKNCPKQRFKISEDGRQIRASQGHTIPIGEAELKAINIEEAKSYDCVVHGTYYKSIGVIMQSGLNRMARQHIHLTASDRVDSRIGVISGFRASCEVLIYVDMVQAIEDGYPFFVSENNVILCSGDENGTLPAKDCQKVIDRKSGEDILQKRLAKESSKSISIPKLKVDKTQQLCNTTRRLK